MKTTREKKDKFIAEGSEIEGELIGYFGREAKIIIADIGACDGLSTVIYSGLFPNARFLCFEPVPKNFTQMLDNLVDYGLENRISRTCCCALGERKGMYEMWLSSGDAPGVEGWDTGNKSSSLLPPKKHLEVHDWCRFEEKIKVQTYPLDQLNLHIDFAHIDVQGAEMMVLKGGRKTFENTSAIWIEVANIELYSGQPMRHDIQRFLNDIGMNCIKDTCGKNKTGDMLWVRGMSYGG